MTAQFSSNTLNNVILVLLTITLVSACSVGSNKKAKNNRHVAQVYYGEDHLIKIQQLTNKGENEQASFTPDNDQIIYRSTHDGLRCYGIFKMDSDGSDISQISSGRGIASGATVAQDNYTIAYSSTYLFDELCPTRPEFSKDYTWVLNQHYDIFSSTIGGGSLNRLTVTDGYDGGAKYSPAGDKILFTSNRTGDLELFIMDADGKNSTQLTDAVGYDGDASFSHDGKMIVWRASRPVGNDLYDYRSQLGRGVFRGGKYEIFMMKLDGGKPIQLTKNKATNFSPTFFPDGSKIIYSSNISQADGRNFDLYTLDLKSKKQERITYYSGFDGYPEFSSNGKKLLFTSSRNFRYKAETNIFIVEWVAEGIYY